ncbi:MAG: ATP-binding protein [Rhizobiales bacterium]|nr:ATP-binding protein [Hyphomicrobiales bacterium]
MTNLLDNVLLHGGADVSKLSVELISEAQEAIIIVEDNGIGIKPEDIPTVMARFGQAQPSQGSGLGLPIAEAVVQRHKGTFTLFPQTSGLRVRISLPLY